MRKVLYICVSMVMLVFFNSANATNYYVSAIFGSNGFPGTFAQPFATLQPASNLTAPGDTVFVMNGTYTTVVDGQAILRIRNSGTETQPIVFKNFPGHTPLISFSTWNAILVSGDCGYIEIEGFKIRGNNSNILLSDALNQPTGCNNPTGSPNSIYNGNGISVDGRSGGHPHHVTIRNNEVFECGGGGIGSNEADYVTIENNLIYNNSWYTRYGTSGISIFHSWDYDNNTSDFKMIVRNNICYGNQLFVPWRSGTTCQGITDGNGIIVDDNRNTQLGTGVLPYNGRVLIINNLCYRNGGRGIHSFLSDNVVILNNTTFQNCKSPEIGDGEITVITGNNLQVYNNIMFARTGNRLSSASSVTNFSENNNLMFNSNLRGFYNINDILANPLFADTANNDFTLLPQSPAINAGNDSAGRFSSSDLVGIARPVGPKPDMGAYEFGGIPAVSYFTQGNIVVTRVGDGNTSLGSNAAEAGIVEYNISGTATGVTVTLGDAGSTAPNRIILSGDNTTGEGQLNLSSDGRYLSVFGYEGAVGSASTTYQANDKVIAVVNFNGLPDYSTRIPGTTINRTVRSAITDNGNRYYVSGSSASPASSNSTRFLQFGTPITTASIAFNGSVRSIKMFKNQVYYANNSTVGTLTPNPASGNYATNVSFPGVNISGHNYQSLALVDLDPNVSYLTSQFDVLYCADLNLGLVKFYWNGTTWVFAGSFNPVSETGVTGGLHDLTVRINASGQPEIFVVKAATPNNNIVLLTDAAGRTESIGTTPPLVTNIVSAGANYMFRGVAFTPSQLVILPINILSFKGLVSGKAVSLQWVTSSEINAKEFVVERSINGLSFEPIGNVNAENNPNGNSYTFDDWEAPKSVVFYRLRLVDLDGSFKFSKVIIIRADKNIIGLDIFPNPVTNNVTISHPKAKTGAFIRILSADGRVVGQYSVAKDAVQTSIDASHLNAGNYFVNYMNDGKSESKMILKW